MSDHMFAIRDAKLLLAAVSEISIPQPSVRRVSARANQEGWS